MSDRCELCLNDNSIRVFPCLYHCKKMLCIQHLSEHDKFIDKQIQNQKQLKNLWKNYNLIFNEEKIREEFQKLKNQLENYWQLKEEISCLLSIDHFHDSMENYQRYQTAIENIQKAIESERKANVQIKFEVEDDATTNDSYLSSPMTMNEESENVESSLDCSNPNGNSPPVGEYLEDIDELYDQEMNNYDETNITPSRNIAASKIRDYCPLTHDGVFGINSHTHGVHLCPVQQPRTYILNDHFRRVHHLTPLASLALARAISSGQDPLTTRLFSDHHIILNINILRTVDCPINKPFNHYPSLQIRNSPCYAVKQVRHLRDHLKRSHKFTSKAANTIVKLVQNDLPIHKIQFPEWMNILENTNVI